MFTLFRLFTLVLCLIFSSLASAAATSNIPISGYSNSPNMAAFDQKFINLMRKWSLPGAALVVIRNGQVIAARGYGWADVSRQEQVQPDSLFRIASVSKTFTAVSILKLAQEHRLNLDDKVFYILNDLKPLNGLAVNPAIYQITVRNLLQMSSGWFAPGSHFDPLFGPWGGRMRTTLNPELPASCETTTRYMMSMPLKRKPGSAYYYSNLDYCILGLIVDKVTGSKYGYLGYQYFVKSHILAPLQIQDMAIGSTQLKYRLPKEVHYYREPGAFGMQELANSFYFPYSTAEILRKNFGNGGWVASALDLAKFIQALNNGQILDSATLNVMRSKPAFVKSGGSVVVKSTKKSGKKKGKTVTVPAASGGGKYYTMGGIIYNIGGKMYWVQTGSFTGTNALIVTKPDNTTIAVIFNTRPSGLLSRLRPELRQMLMSSDF